MKLFLIRHLPTAWNQEGKLQGRKDIPIKKPDQKSLKKINEVKKKLKKNPISKCFSSPLKRAIDTAKVYGFDSPIVDERIIEYDFGSYEGKLKEEMLESIGIIWFDQIQRLNLGERFNDFEKRIESFVRENQYLTSALIFSHGFVIRYILAKYKYHNINYINHFIVENNHLYHIEI